MSFKITNDSTILFALMLIGMIMLSPAMAAQSFDDVKEPKFALGLGYAGVNFNTNYKFTNKETGNSVFVDAEGTLGMPKRDAVGTIYGALRVKEKHYFLFSHFRVNREVTLFDEELNLDDLVVVRGKATLSDKTHFYNLNYGYSLKKDNRSNVKLRAGLNVMDFKYVLKAEGELEIDGVLDTSGTFEDDVSLLVPLPLIGVDMSFRFTPRWSVAAKVALVGGKYQEVTATAWQTSLNTSYRFNRRVGVVMGVTYFDADVTVEDEKEKQEIVYGYSGLYAGVHLMF
jgi:hypothetical protein